MGLKIGFRKKAICLGLALHLVLTAVPWQNSLNVKAAVSDQEEKVTLESVREEAKASYESDEKMGFDMDLDQTFTGSGLDYSSDAQDRQYMQVFNNLKDSKDDQTVIIRFKTTKQDGILFGVGTDAANSGKNMIFGLQNGSLRAVIRNIKDATKESDGSLKGNFNTGSLADGKYHTAAISFLPSMGAQAGNVRFVVDGGPDIYISSWGNSHIAGFNQNQDAYNKFQIAAGDYAGELLGAQTAFDGEIDFLTVINKAYSVSDLQNITRGDKNLTNFSYMWTAGTCHTWLFTGGAEGVASFATGGTTRNWVGLFEDTMRNNGSFVERGRFVFNTAKRNADVRQILDEYDVRIAPFGTYVVGIMIGEADYRKGQSGIEDFKTNLQALLDKVADDGKLPLVLTPYPSAKEEDASKVSDYTNAILEVAQDRIKVVNLSGMSRDYIQENGSLTAAGHQVIANQLKAAVGTNSSTNYSFGGLTDGSYIVAKQTDDGSLAQVKNVKANKKGIIVKVADELQDADAQASVRLEYTLTDSSGTEISETVSDGASEFEAAGLIEGETYILRVYDVSRGNVKESYQPVKILIGEGNKGVNLDYEDANVSVNEKIQSLLKREEPATYLFMGDSITHGITTDGYDNVPQMFAKYLDEIGRTDDIVINTGVSNATIATTLDQIEPRLMRYNPDVVMIMLGTNDVSYNGQNVVTNGNAESKGITVEEYKDRYKTLVRKIHENNAESSVVLRIPCEMLVDNAHEGYEEKFLAIYDVAKEMREEISGLNIAVVNHMQEWRDYSNHVRNDNIARTGEYCWLKDNVHPNGRGNLSMFQQIIKELGLYVNTSELANYQYAVNDWTGSSEMGVSVVQRKNRVSLPMGQLSEYERGLQEATLTLTADGRTISKTADYSADKEIVIAGVDPQKEYTVLVTGKDAQDSKEISFQAEIEVNEDPALTESEQAEYDMCLSDAKVEDESLYPADVLAAYKKKLADIEAKYEGKLTLQNLERALSEIRDARNNFEQDVKTAELRAKRDLADALANSEQTYQAQKEKYNTLQSWNAYQAAYENAKAADEDTHVDILRSLLKELTQAEQKLKEEKEKLEQLIPPPQKPETGQKIEEGKVYEADNYSYKVISLSKKTVEIAGLAKNRTLKKIIVDDVVSLNGESYKIVSIGKEAFLNNKRITGVTIGKNVQFIRDRAFSGCSGLKSVTINSKKLKEIGSKAFYNCKKLTKIVIKSTSLKKAGKNAFKGTAKKLQIKVPKTKLKKYGEILSKKGQNKKAKIIK